MAVLLKRIYDAPAASDGKRVLVDRLWPRGVSKGSARLECWLRDLAPSDSLRKWFGHRPERFSVFRRRYLKELSSPAASRALERLYSLVRASSVVTLVFAAKDTERNNAVVIKELLEGMRKPPASSGALRAVSARARAPRR